MAKLFEGQGAQEEEAPQCDVATQQFIVTATGSFSPPPKDEEPVGEEAKPQE